MLKKILGAAIVGSFLFTGILAASYSAERPILNNKAALQTPTPTPSPSPTADPNDEQKPTPTPDDSKTPEPAPSPSPTV